MKIGKTDVFERHYRERFRAFVARFGEFINYERDRGARDIGLHLTKKSKEGEQLSSTLCWFQLKGVMKDTLPKEKFEKSPTVKFALKLDHLKFWYLQPTPTYLVLYVESVDTFLIMDIQKYIKEKLGEGILRLKQQELTVEIPTKSVMDDQAFSIILRNGDILEWQKLLGKDEKDLRLVNRDYELILALSDATDRGATCRFRFINWLSKMRGECYFDEYDPQSKEWKELRSHWQLGLRIGDLEETYPYLAFKGLEEDLSDFENSDEEDSEFVPFTLNSGDLLVGREASGEYVEYTGEVRLNEQGRQFLDWIMVLIEVGILILRSDGRRSIDVAPWHSREV